MSEPTNTEIMQAIDQLGTRVGQEFNAQEEKINALAEEVKGLTNLSHTIQNKVDAVRYNQDSLAGVIGAMQVSQNALMGAVLDLRRDFTNHTHP